MEPRIYVYRITFVDQPYWYWGYHKERRFDEYYMGSPVTNKRYWEMFEPIKEIVEIFDYSEEGEVLAQIRENELIKPDLENPLCLNEHYGGIISSRALSESTKKLWQNPEYKEEVALSISRSMTEAWKNCDYRERMLSITGSVEFREKMSESTRKVWEDPLRRQSHSEIMTEVWQDPEFRKRRSEGAKEKWKDLEYREKVSRSIGESIKKKWQDPDYREMRSKYMREKWQDPDYRRTRSKNLEREVKLSRSSRKDSFREEVNQRFQSVLDSDIDLNVFGWVTKVAKLWGVSHAQVKRIFDKYWEGPPPYRR